MKRIVQITALMMISGSSYESAMAIGAPLLEILPPSVSMPLLGVMGVGIGTAVGFVRAPKKTEAILGGIAGAAALGGLTVGGVALAKKYKAAAEKKAASKNLADQDPEKVQEKVKENEGKIVGSDKVEGDLSDVKGKALSEDLKNIPSEPINFENYPKYDGPKVLPPDSPSPATIEIAPYGTTPKVLPHNSENSERISEQKRTISADQSQQKKDHSIHENTSVNQVGSAETNVKVNSSNKNNDIQSEQKSEMNHVENSQEMALDQEEALTQKPSGNPETLESNTSEVESTQISGDRELLEFGL